MTLNYAAIGKRIKAARKQQGLTQMVFAERIDLSISYLSYIENGVKSFSLDTFIRIANALHTTADELLLDCLDNTDLVHNHEAASILADCSDYEKRVLLDTITAVKQSLRENHDHSRQRS